MAGTRRTPISRQATAQITPYVIDLFAKALKLRSYSPRADRAHRNYLDTCLQLHQALRRKPWEEDICDVAYCKEPPEWYTSSLALEDWHSAKEIERTLQQALRARRELAREARRKRQPPPPPAPEQPPA